MEAQPIQPKTVGELRAALAQFDDDTPVVVDGYEGGFSDAYLKLQRVLFDVGYPNGGPHRQAADYDDLFEENLPAPVVSLVISRSEYVPDGEDAGLNKQ